MLKRRVVALVLVAGVLASCSSESSYPTVSADSLVSATSPSGQESPVSTPDTSVADVPDTTLDATSVETGDDGAGSVAAPGDPTFPLRIEDGVRHLIDANGEPFLVNGDAAWSLMVELDRDEVDDYIASRQQHGFNTVLIELVEHYFSTDPPNNAAGDAPFTTPGDFSTPNEAYFEHADWVLQRFADAGFLVLLTPAYLGWEGGPQGWWSEMVAAGPDVLRGYGRFVGNRYARFDNIIWVAGGDHTPSQPELVDAVAAGIHETDPTALHTVHLAPDDPPRDLFGDTDWFDIDNVYTYGPVLGPTHAAYRSTTMPFLMFESTYENEHGATTRQLRTQAYHGLLGGAAGHIFGNNPIWHFDGPGVEPAEITWQEALEGPGSRSMGALSRIMSTVPWWTLAPDLDRDLIIDGNGSGNDEAAAAVADDRSLAVVYVPTERTITLDLGQLAAGVDTITWVDPVTGEPAFGATTVDVGPIRLETPGENAGGDGDWIVTVTAS